MGEEILRTNLTFLSALLILIIVLSSICGCIGNNDDNKEDKETKISDKDKDGVPDDIDPNPNKNIDTDIDGLSNDWEIVNTKTDINKIDTDGDGWNDLRDVKPLNASAPPFKPNHFNKTEDSDEDGYPDPDDKNKYGYCDVFPLDPTQWSDIDRDGLGDNPNGNNPDPYPYDPSRYP